VHTGAYWSIPVKPNFVKYYYLAYWCILVHISAYRCIPVKLSFTNFMLFGILVHTSAYWCIPGHICQIQTIPLNYMCHNVLMQRRYACAALCGLALKHCYCIKVCCITAHTYRCILIPKNSVAFVSVLGNITLHIPTFNLFLVLQAI
jgi:hypothetical protein